MILWRSLTTDTAVGVNATVSDTVQDTGEATQNAIEGIQSITSLLHLPSWFGRVVFIVLVVVITAALVRVVNKFFRATVERLKQDGNQSTTLVAFLRYVVLFVVYFISAVTIISSIPGASNTLTALLASGGLVAVVVGLAGQDALGNVVGGVMILAFKPFVIGDVIQTPSIGVSGTVEEIALRHTVIRTPANKRVIIPNGTMSGAIIENADYADSHICEFYEVTVTYESDLDLAVRILRETVENNPLYLDVRTPEQIAEGMPKVQVRVVELAESAVVVRAWLWSENLSSSFELKFQLNEQIKKAYDSAGVEFAYPHVTVVK